MKIAKGGLSWIIFSFILLIMLSIIAVLSDGTLKVIFLFFAVLSGLFFVLLFVFFRDPDRVIGKGIVASADGVISFIEEIKERDIGNCTTIATFMNIYNVHVNRMPCDGVLEKIVHHPGGHIPAFKKESERNERVELLFKTEFGKIKVVQIAGTLARRIVPYIKKGDKLKKGDKIGLIRLGSRVDIYLPLKSIKNMSVKKGDKVIAGVSAIGKIND